MANYLDERQQALNQYQANNNPSFQDKTNTLINQMMQHTQAQPQQMNMPTPYQGFNPATSQSYQAAMNTATRNAQQASNNAMVQAGSKGIGNSSLLADRMAQIEQQAMGRVSDTLLPQYEQMDYGRYRDTVGDQFKVNDINYSRGQDQQRSASELANFMAGLTQQSKDNQYRQDAFGEQQKRGNIADAINLSQLFGMAVQPKESGQVLFDQVNGMKTVGGQQAEYTQLRDQITDQQYQQKFDEDVRRFGLQYAADQAYRSGQLKQQQQNDLYRQWEMTGQAPEGIQGVNQGTNLYDKVGARQDQQPVKIDNKTSTDNTSYFKSQMSGKSDLTKDQALSYIQSNADHMTDSDYRALIKWIEDKF